MDTELRAVKAALADISDIELQALIDATRDGTQTAQDLLAWIDAACEWERNRRTGRDSELQPPEAAIPPEEDAVSIDAAIDAAGAVLAGRIGSARRRVCAVRRAGGAAHRRRAPTVTAQNAITGSDPGAPATLARPTC